MRKMTTHKELAARIAPKVKMNKVELSNIFKLINQMIAEEVAAGRTFSVDNFGTFHLSNKPKFVPHATLLMLMRDRLEKSSSQG